MTHPNVDDGVGAVALQGVEGQLPLEVAGVQPGDGKAVAVAGLRTHTHAHTHDDSYNLQSSMGNVSKCTMRLTEDAPEGSGSGGLEGEVPTGANGCFSLGCTELLGRRVNN